LAGFIALSPSQKSFGNIWVLASAFVGAGASTAISIVHTLFVEDIYLRSSPMPLVVAAGIAYIGGAIIYAKEWPECKYKVRFDNFGNSHNIFHVACVIGALLCWIASIRMFHERQLYHCPI
jgi:adiponectin receptor